MTRSLRAPLLALLVLAVSPSALAQRPGHDPVMRSLFPPDLVMEHQREIGLRPEQRQAITDSIRETQGELLDVRWQLKDAHQQLAELLGAQPIDEAGALVQAETVMSLEQEVKKRHMRLLIRIKNQLDPDQQARLRELRPRDLRPGPPNLRPR